MLHLHQWADASSMARARLPCQCHHRICSSVATAVIAFGMHFSKSSRNMYTVELVIWTLIQVQLCLWKTHEYTEAIENVLKVAAVVAWLLMLVAMRCFEGGAPYSSIEGDKLADSKEASPCCDFDFDAIAMQVHTLPQ
jgi:hypothetical protein